MVLKEEVIKERLQHMKKALDELRDISKFEKDKFLRTLHLQWSAERGLQILCESVFDIGNHILVGEYNEAPADYQSIIILLGKHEVISDDLKTKFNKLGGFRNLLVHDYSEIDEKEIFTKLQTKLIDFENFIKETVLWLGKI